MRVQPFSVLGHNGEINTIARLRAEARMLGVPIRDDSSDSQDLNRLIETLIHRRGLSLPEAMELAVPPIVNEIRQFPEDAARLLHVPAPGDGAVRAGADRADRAHTATSTCSPSTRSACARCGRSTPHDSYVFSSEPGVVPLADMTGEPKPLVARREGDGADQARQGRAPVRPPGDAAAGPQALARAHRRARRSPASSRRSRPAARSRARRSPATTRPGRPSR